MTVPMKESCNSKYRVVVSQFSNFSYFCFSKQTDLRYSKKKKRNSNTQMEQNIVHRNNSILLFLQNDNIYEE